MRTILAILLLALTSLAAAQTPSVHASMKGFDVAFNNLPTTATAVIRLDSGTSSTVIFRGPALGGEAAGFGKRFGLATEPHYIRLALGDGKTTETLPSFGPFQCPDFLTLGGPTFPEAAMAEAQQTAKVMGGGAEAKAANKALILDSMRQALKRAANAQRDLNKALRAAEAAAAQATEDAAKY